MESNQIQLQATSCIVFDKNTRQLHVRKYTSNYSQQTLQFAFQMLKQNNWNDRDITKFLTQFQLLNQDETVVYSAEYVINKFNYSTKQGMREKLLKHQKLIQNQDYFILDKTEKQKEIDARKQLMDQVKQQIDSLKSQNQDQIAICSQISNLELYYQDLQSMANIIPNDSIINNFKGEYYGIYLTNDAMKQIGMELSQEFRDYFISGEKFTKSVLDTIEMMNKDNITKLQQTIANQKDTIKTLEKTQQEHIKEIDDLESQNVNYISQQGELVEQNSTLRDQIEQYENDKEQLQKDLQNIQQQKTQLQEQKTQLEQQNDELQSKIDKQVKLKLQYKKKLEEAKKDYLEARQEHDDFIQSNVSYNVSSLDKHKEYILNRLLVQINKDFQGTRCHKIYMLALLQNNVVKYIKIGYTTRDIETRMKEIEKEHINVLQNKCSIRLIDVFQCEQINEDNKVHDDIKSQIINKNTEIFGRDYYEANDFVIDAFNSLKDRYEQDFLIKNDLQTKLNEYIKKYEQELKKDKEQMQRDKDIYLDMIKMKDVIIQTKEQTIQQKDDKINVIDQQKTDYFIIIKNLYEKIISLQSSIQRATPNSQKRCLEITDDLLKQVKFDLKNKKII